MSFTINFPTNNVSSTDIIKRVEEAQNILLYQEDDLNTYSGANYQIKFNNNNGSFNFNNLDLEFIRSYMNPICDTINLKRGQYDIIDNNTNQIVDPKSITLKNVLDEEDGEMTPNNNNNDDNEFELTIAFDITNQQNVTARIRNEAKIPLKYSFYMDTALSVDVRNRQVVIIFYKNNEELIKTTLDDIAKIVGIDTNEYKLYDEINGTYVVIQSNKNNVEPIVPYVVSIARPDRKCPKLEQYFKQGFLTDVKEEAAEIIYEDFIEYVFMYENNKKKNITVKSFEKCYDEYYSDGCMYNEPWEANAFIDGKWEDITPTHEELYQLYLKYYDDYSDSEAEEDDDSGVAVSDSESEEESEWETEEEEEEDNKLIDNNLLAAGKYAKYLMNSRKR